MTAASLFPRAYRTTTRDADRRSLRAHRGVHQHRTLNLFVVGSPTPQPPQAYSAPTQAQFTGISYPSGEDAVGDVRPDRLSNHRVRRGRDPEPRRRLHRQVRRPDRRDPGHHLRTICTSPCSASRSSARRRARQRLQQGKSGRSLSSCSSSATFVHEVGHAFNRGTPRPIAAPTPTPANVDNDYPAVRHISPSDGVGVFGLDPTRPAPSSTRRPPSTSCVLLTINQRLYLWGLNSAFAATRGRRQGLAVRASCGVQWAVLKLDG